MKTAIFNFLVLQVIVWAFVFSTNNKNQAQEVNYASITDTWEVAKIGNNNPNDVLIHYPTFNKLTLNPNGTYLRLKDHETFEKGNWQVDEEKSVLTLINDHEIKKFDIIQLPSSNSEAFIIKENASDANARGDVKYELTRM